MAGRLLYFQSSVPLLHENVQSFVWEALITAIKKDGYGWARHRPSTRSREISSQCDEKSIFSFKAVNAVNDPRHLCQSAVYTQYLPTWLPGYLQTNSR